MNVLVADDHPLVRDALCRTMLRAEALAIVHEAQDFAGVQAQCAAISPVLALIDLNMPGMIGLTGLRWLRSNFPAMAMIVASGQEDAPTIRAVLAVGARGFFPKSAAPELLLQAIRLVQAGGIYVPAGALADFQDGLPPAKADTAGLTPRQLDVLQGLLRGLPNKLIARELGLTDGTVKIHIAAILRALQARNRTEAVVRARELGVGDGS
ncbi:MAG: response regulator transcription factor [Paucibacter sp.]|nr:response regulator transcription factor [Roseateles sp.]